MTREELIDALPDSVKVLHRDFRLVEKSVTDFATDGKLGSANMVKAEIQFLDTNDTDTVDTLVHEVLHTICHMFDLDFEGDVDEEHVVRAMSTGLVTIMRDNPGFFPTLQAILDESAVTAGD